MANEIWIIGICNSESSVYLEKVVGNLKQVKEYLWKLILKERKDNEDTFDFGTDNIENIYIQNNEMHGYNCFYDSHTEYEAIRLDDIYAIEL